jgi:tRNA-dihydrouridine synthase
MNKRSSLFALVPALLFAGAANAQYPVMEMVANKVVQRYEQSSCEQLWEKKGQPKSPEEQRAVQLLREDPQMAAAFLNRVAAPIANKMFQCGMIP